MILESGCAHSQPAAAYYTLHLADEGKKGLWLRDLDQQGLGGKGSVEGEFDCRPKSPEKASKLNGARDFRREIPSY